MSIVSLPEKQVCAPRASELVHQNTQVWMETENKRSGSLLWGKRQYTQCSDTNLDKIVLDKSLCFFSLSGEKFLGLNMKEFTALF